jgi:hypothetical protein
MDDYFRLQAPTLPIKPTPKGSTRWLRDHYRYCNDDSFANIMEDWNDFRVPQFPLEIRLDAHYCPPLELISQIRHASVNSMQRWIYRILTYKQHCIRPGTPICVSHPRSVQRFVQLWELDGYQFCHLAAREKLLDPVLTDDLADTCKYTREIMCDIVWLELCYSRGEKIGIERATRHLRAHMDQYLRYGEVESKVGSRVGSKKEPRGHRRNLTDTQLCRVTMSHNTIKEENQRLSLGARVTVTPLNDGDITPRTKSEPEPKGSDDTTQKMNQWGSTIGWPNPLKRSKIKRKSSTKSQYSTFNKFNHETDRPFPYPPINDMPSRCVTPDDRRQTSYRNARHSLEPNVSDGQNNNRQVSDPPSNRIYKAEDPASTTALKSQRTSCDYNRRNSHGSDALGSEANDEEWNVLANDMTQVDDRMNNMMQSDGPSSEEFRHSATKAYGWLELESDESDY